jgi:hypothetical protein
VKTAVKVLDFDLHGLPELSFESETAQFGWFFFLGQKRHQGLTSLWLILFQALFYLS